MTTLTHYIKCCATCDNWGGQREPADPRGHSVSVDVSAKGECYAKIWPNEQQQNTNGNCRGYVKWKRLEQ